MSSTAKVKPPSHPVVFTANRLRDGRVVWLGPQAEWLDGITGAACFPPEAAEHGLALARQGERQQRVVGVYAVEVAPEAASPRPLKFRERLRMLGPSTEAAAAVTLAV